MVARVPHHRGKAGLWTVTTFKVVHCSITRACVEGRTERLATVDSSTRFTLTLERDFVFKFTSSLCRSHGAHTFNSSCVKQISCAFHATVAPTALTLPSPRVFVKNRSNHGKVGKITVVALQRTERQALGWGATCFQALRSPETLDEQGTKSYPSTRCWR